MIGISLGILLASTFLTPVAPFSPSELFAAGEQGVWLDPTLAANTDWRRNLLTYTEQFDNAAWVKLNATITANAAVAPDGTNTAEKLTDNAVNDNHAAFFDLTVANATAYTASVYVKKSENDFFRITLSTESVFVWFNIATGAVGTVTGTGVTAAISDAGNGWYRCSVTKTSTTTSWRVSLNLAKTNGGAGYAGNGSDSSFIWGAQLEAGATATDYQRISDVHTEVRERFPNNHLFQDNLGTTPVTAVGQTVGFVGDKSKGFVVGPEKVSNGTFAAGTTGWLAGFGTTTSTFTASGGVATLTSGGGDTVPRFVTAVTGCVVGNYYLVSFTEAGATITGQDQLLVWTSGSNGTGGTTVNQTTAPGWTNETKTFCLPATATTMYVAVAMVGATNGDAAAITNISVRELPGNHATQPTVASRPVLGRVPFGGRRNLLTFTEQFDNAAWGKVNITAAANSIPAPDGTTTADTLRLNAGGSVAFAALGLFTTGAASHVSETTATALSAGAHTCTIYVRSGANISHVQLRVGTNANLTTLVSGALVRLSDGVIVDSSATSAAVTDAGGGWWRVAISFTATAVVHHVGVWLWNSTSIGSAIGNESVHVWGAQLEVGSVATPYQRVTTAFDVTQAGVPDNYYLSFDGTDDFLVTGNINFSATDEMTVIAGVRKLTETVGIIAEMGPSTTVTNGTISIYTQNTARYAMNYKGTENEISVNSTSIFNSPVTTVLSVAADISARLLSMRANGVANALSTGTTGTGTFSAAQPLYIGRRAGTTFAFNGHLFGLIVRGKTTSGTDLTNAETYMAEKTGVIF